MTKKTWKDIGLTPTIDEKGITFTWKDLADTGLVGSKDVTAQQFLGAILVKYEKVLTGENRRTNPDETISIDPAQAEIDNFTDPENPRYVTGFNVRAHTDPPPSPKVQEL